MVDTQEILIEFKADTTGLTDAITQLEKMGAVDKKAADQFRNLNAQQTNFTNTVKQSGQAINQADANVNKLGTSMQNLNAKTQGSTNSIKNLLSGLSPSFDGLTNSLKGIGAGILAAFSVEKIMEFSKQSIKAFQEAELNAKKLQTAVGVNGGVSSDYDRLIHQSEELQKITIFSDDDIQRAQTAALQFGLTTQQVERLLPVVTDFASATGQDLGSALDAVIQGVNGMERGLKRYGVQVDSTLDSTGKLDSIIQQLNKHYEGQAVIVGETAIGAMKKYENQIDDLQELIGSKLSPALETLQLGVLGVTNDLLDFISLDFGSKESLADQIDKARAMVAKYATKLDDAALAQQRLNASADLEKAKKQRDSVKAGSDEYEKLAANVNFLIGKLSALNEEYNRRSSVGERAKQEVELTRLTTKELQKRLEIARQSNLIADKDLADAIQKELDKRLKAENDASSKLIEERKKNSQALADATKADSQKLLEAEAGSDIERLLIQKKADEDRAKSLFDASQKTKQDTLNLNIELENIERLYAKKITDIQKEKNDKLLSEDEKSDKARLAEMQQHDEDELQDQKDKNDKLLELEKQKNEQRAQLAIQAADFISQLIQDGANLQIDAINEQRDIELKSIDEKLQANQDARQKELISETQFVAENKKLLDQKAKAEEEAQKKALKLKREAAIAAKLDNIFKIGIESALAIVKYAADPFTLPLVPFIEALTAIQLASVIAAPLPKYAKGTLSLQRGTNPSGVDTIPIMANEGEAITPTKEARDYNHTLKAIHTRSVPAEALNRFVKSFTLREFPTYSSNSYSSIEIDYDKLGQSVAWHSRDLVEATNKGLGKVAESIRYDREHRPSFTIKG